ncbi:sperm flagellar protein 1-like [Drosophila innubila]|uniref:sperm flagellar protein 1-like n=1 Tax=Drosophila innubila TaxID=198719 RepID=UPI00148D1742|nr:sperm flagellar protein 1-like [Drosophila innubila]
MPFSSTLNSKEQEKLDEWLQTKNIILNNRTRRDLSDAVTIAQLFKKLDTSLVNMDNYISHCSLALKLENWETLNFKVLRRMGFILSASELEELAMGKLDALRSLLYRLMCIGRDGGAHYEIFPKITSTQSQNQVQKPPQSDLSKNAIKREKLEDDFVSDVSPSKNIPYSKYETLMDENRKKDKYICSVKHKVQYLESLILVKEERINNLLEHLETLSGRISS